MKLHIKILRNIITLIAIFTAIISVKAETWENVGINSDMRIFSLDFIDEDLGFAVGELDFRSYVLRTVNGGELWDIELAPTVIVGVCAVDDKTAFAFGGDESTLTGMIYFTRNGGVSWTQELFDGYQHAKADCIIDIKHIGDSVLIAGCCGGLILKSEDLGATWRETSQRLGSQHVGVLQFLDDSLGFALTGLSVSYFNNIHITRDAGETWNVVKSFKVENATLFDMDFTSENDGWVFGYYDGSEAAVASEDGGARWDKMFFGSTQNALKAGDFIDKQTGFIVSGDGSLYFTSNAGIEWRKQATGSSDEMSDVVFVSPRRAYCSGANGTILRYSAPSNVEVRDKSDVAITYSPRSRIIIISTPSDAIDADYRVEIFDALGRETIKKRLYSNESRISAGELSAGAYLVVLQDRIGNYIKRNILIY